MLAKKHKEYIRENWINHKLDVSKDVWRLEISIKGNTWKFVDVDNGEIRKLDLHDLRSILNLESIYFGHLDKYFDFRYNKPQVKRTRLKKITLFDKSCDNAIFMMAFKTDESNRMDKIFIRMLEKYNCQLRESKREYKEQLSIIVKDYSYDKGLTGFYNKIATQENQFRKDLRIDKQISDNLDTHYKKAE
jgi:hypothetical protein